MSQTATATAALDVDLIVERYVAVWNEADAAARAHAVAELWPAQGVEFVEGAQFRGREALVDRVTQAHTLFVATGQYEVTHEGHVAVHDHVVVLTIQLAHACGEQAGDVAWAARVFLVLDDDGRILEDYHLTVQPLPEA
ncbi:hypothetical protein [Streptomyces camelliae]|uniref:SnoaL-like domain-containing protein n=1 Tax=Streptomyces camelliae TaxID=3004093 RepID=A0ABY7NUJ1_9ACTN|nr:hypothetical protein [Streptomyces sp. HUAS 2-6]WBO61913.1 hypothetical protein O1G22_03195 [Streptomyces sp. HUAS 2-6]